MNLLQVRRMALVSIHTPARGVTHNTRNLTEDRAVSIHTPARGVTVSNLGHLFSISYTIENANERFCIREKRVLIIYECQHIDSQDVRKFQ